MKIKTSELTGNALDWVVAKIEGHPWRCAWMLESDGFIAWRSFEQGWGNPTPRYSTDWSQGGPIIEREKISLTDPHNDHFHPGEWAAYKRMIGTETCGLTPLIAAMRCFVASKLGDEVDVPEGLLA
jgi:hypothetical protein